MQSSTKAIVPNIVSKSRGRRNSTAVTAGECTLYRKGGLPEVAK